MKVGSGVITLNLNAHTITDDSTIPGTATATVSFVSDGTLVFVGSTSPPSPDVDEWVIEQLGFGDGSLYEVAFTVLVSGDGPDTGPGLGVFSALGSNRTWTLTRTDDSASGVWTFVVREIADIGNSVTANMTMTAQVLP